MEIVIVGALGLAVGEVMRRRLNRLGYRLAPAEQETDGADRTPEVDETALLAPGTRWWITVVLGVVWGCVGWRCPVGWVRGWPDAAEWAYFLGWLGFAGIGLGMAVIDLDVRRLPDRYQILLALVTLVFGILAFWEFPIRLLVGLVAALVCGLVFLVMHAVSRGSLGLGDVKLVMTCGWWLGLTSVPSVFAGLMVSCVLAVAYSLFSRQRQFAFGPWLVAGTLVAGLYLARV